MTRRPLLRAFLATSAAAAMALIGAAPATAGPLVASAADCGSPSSAPVFEPWLDPAEYFLAPDGGFEAGASGWDLQGAAVVAGNEPYEISGPGRHSLAVAPGSRATSPTVCVGVTRPTIRFFAVESSGDALATLRVDVLFEDGLGEVRTATAGAVSGSATWSPSPVMVLAPSLLPLLPGEMTPVAFHFVAEAGSWQVDDVHVDPYGSR